MSNDLTKVWRTNDEQITVDRLNAEIERLNKKMNETYIAHYADHVIKLVRCGEIWKSFVKGKEWGGESADRHRCLENAKEALDETGQGEFKPKTEWLINGIKVTVERDPAASDDETEFTYKVVSYVFRMDGLRAKILPGFDALETMVWLNKLEREQ